MDINNVGQVLLWKGFKNFTIHKPREIDIENGKTFRLKWGEETPEPTNQQLGQWEIEYNTHKIKADLIENFTKLVQNHLDLEAQKAGYDSIHTAVTYANEDSVVKFQGEGILLRSWRSLVWEKCYQILADVEAGDRDQPTEEELILELPTIGT